MDVFLLCSSFEHLIPAVNLHQSCELWAPRFLWEAQAHLRTRPKTLILPSMPWFMLLRVRWSRRTKQLGYLPPSWMQRELCLGFTSIVWSFQLDKRKPRTMPKPLFHLHLQEKSSCSLYKIKPWSSGIDNWNSPFIWGIMWSSNIQCKIFKGRLKLSCKRQTSGSLPLEIICLPSILKLPGPNV